MAEITLTVNASKALAALAGLSGPNLEKKTSAALREAALFGERTVVGFTPVRTGAARGSITTQQVGGLGWRIFSPLKYVPPLERGSRAHVIRPRGGKFLRFTVGSTVVYARQVRHPGSKGARMFERSVPIIAAQLPAIVAKVLKP